MGDCSNIFSHINIQLGNTYIIKKGIKLVTLQVSTNKKKGKTLVQFVVVQNRFGLPFHGIK